MSIDSLEHRIRVSLGKAFHHKHTTKEGAVDIEAIASEHGVSNDQVQEQIAYLKRQNILSGPLGMDESQVEGVPAGDHDLTFNGLGWATAGYPII